MLLALFTGCDEDNDVTTLNGTYTGTFRRYVPVEVLPISNVTVFFTSTGFSGYSDLQRYPAVCKGKYVLRRDKIDLENQCAWTAEFDWTYILSGSFDITKVQNKIVMTRRYDENHYDQYILERQ